MACPGHALGNFRPKFCHLRELAPHCPIRVDIDKRGGYHSDVSTALSPGEPFLS